MLLIDTWCDRTYQFYNAQHSKYHLKNECSKNLCLLAEKFSRKSTETTVLQINKKMLSLKNHFSTEKRKVETSSNKSGGGVSNI